MIRALRVLLLVGVIAVGGFVARDYLLVRETRAEVATPEPEAIKTNEELYLTGLRIEQFHNPDRDPEPYWAEALKRDPGDTRVNTALGIKAYKQS